jgi:hypothetical protein
MCFQREFERDLDFEWDFEWLLEYVSPRPFVLGFTFNVLERLFILDFDDDDGAPYPLLGITNPPF